MTLQTHLEKRFAALFAAYRKERKRCQRNPDADSVHDVRVASRRIIETIRAYREVLARASANPVEAGLKRWMKATGSVRDLDIALELVREWRPGESVLAASMQAKREKRWRKVDSLARSKKVWDGSAAPKELIGSSSRAGQGSAWDLTLSAPENGALALPLLVERYALHGDRITPGKSKPADYHALRLRTKRLRYTLESFTDIYQSGAFAELLSVCKDFQQTLGSLHDCEAASELAQAIAPKASLSQDDAAAFHAFLQQRAEALRAAFHRQWEEFRKPETHARRIAMLREPIGSFSRAPVEV